MSAVQLPVQEVWILDLSLHSALSDLCQFMEVGVEELVHGTVFRKSAVTGDDPVAELQKAAAAVGIADVLHQVRRNPKFCLKQVPFILLQVQEHKEFTVAEHGLDCRCRQKIGDVLGDCRAKTAHLPYLTPDLFEVGCRILVVGKVCR